MADQLKILGQTADAVVGDAAEDKLLYTAPDLAMTTISSMIVCNSTAATLTFVISVHVADSSTDDKQFIFYDTPLAGNSTLTSVLGITLSEGDYINAYSSATGMSFNLFGVETSR